jgi:hypothetical protein
MNTVSQRLATSAARGDRFKRRAPAVFFDRRAACRVDVQRYPWGNDPSRDRAAHLPARQPASARTGSALMTVATAGLLVPELGLRFDEGRDTAPCRRSRARAEADRLALQLGLEGLAERADRGPWFVRRPA